MFNNEDCEELKYPVAHKKTPDNRMHRMALVRCRVGFSSHRACVAWRDGFTVAQCFLHGVV